MIRLAFRECRALLREIFLNILVLTVLFSVILALISFSNSALRDMNDMIRKETNGIPLQIKVTNPDASTVKCLQQTGFDQLTAVFHSASKIEDGDLQISSETVTLSGRNFSVNADTAAMPPVPRNINEEEVVWISDQFAESLNVQINGIVTLHLNNKTAEPQCIVAGIYTAEEGQPDIMFSIQSYSHILHEFSFSEKYYLTAQSDDYSKYGMCIRKLQKAQQNYTVDPVYQYISNNVSTLVATCTGLLGISVILIISAMMVFSSFFNIILMQRAKCISIQLQCGMTAGRIVWLYWLVMQIIHIVVIIISTPCGILLMRCIGSDYVRVFQFHTNAPQFEWLSIPELSFVLSLLLLLSTLKFRHKLYKMNGRLISDKGDKS